MANDLKVVSSYPFSPASQELLRQGANAEVVITRPEEFASHLPEAEIACALSLPGNWRELAPHLRWLQCPGAGVDGLRPSGVLDASSGVMVTTASGIHVNIISEYVFGSMIMFNRNWPQMVHLQDRHLWPRDHRSYQIIGRELADQMLGIIGLGHIGRRIAELGQAFGMRVLAMRRSLHKAENIPAVDRFYPGEQLHEMLGLCDYVVLVVPLTPETEKMIGEAELRAMRPGAYLVNVGRGHLIDEAALIRALQERWIAGAGLDVTAQEPLPADSVLYTLPNVILTPHIAGDTVHYEKRLAALFAQNLERYRAGQPLRNLYDPARGY